VAHVARCDAQQKASSQQLTIEKLFEVVGNKRLRGAKTYLRRLPAGNTPATDLARTFAEEIIFSKFLNFFLNFSHNSNFLSNFLKFSQIFS
jgi:hypothetical protein